MYFYSVGTVYCKYVNKDIQLSPFLLFRVHSTLGKGIPNCSLYYVEGGSLLLCLKKKKTSETRQSELCAYITWSAVHAQLSCQILCNLCHFSKSADVHCVHAWGQRSTSGLKTICMALSDSRAGQIFWISWWRGNCSHSAFCHFSKMRHSVQF